MSDLGSYSNKELREEMARRAGLVTSTKMNMVAVLAELAAERARQDAKWGEQNHPFVCGEQTYGVEDTYHCGGYDDLSVSDDARNRCEDRFKRGVGSYADILLEEVYEAIDAARSESRAALRKELVQCAAVLVAAIEAHDRYDAAHADEARAFAPVMVAGPLVTELTDALERLHREHAGCESTRDLLSEQRDQFCAERNEARTACGVFTVDSFADLARSLAASEAKYAALLEKLPGCDSCARTATCQWEEGYSCDACEEQEGDGDATDLPWAAEVRAMEASRG